MKTRLHFSYSNLCFADNSGQALPYTTCQVWSNNPAHTKRSLKAIREITQGVIDAGIQDVVTGLGLLNEPFADCDEPNYIKFMNDGFDIVRETLGPAASVYVSDMFQAPLFNNGTWWLDSDKHHNTYLDSHYYQVFEATTRDLSPRQHIAFTCENHHRRATSCCYEDAPNNTKPSQGVSRMIGEWSASFDILPAARISEIMDGIADTGKAPYFDRQLSEGRKEFLRNYVEAQMVTFEAADTHTAGAWFYWTMKMEGGAFAEWSFLRGVEDGWFPTLPDPTEPSQSLFGTCFDIMFRTDDDMTIVHEFPEPSGSLDGDVFTYVDDDVVLSHGDSLLPSEDIVGFVNNHWLLLGAILVAAGVAIRMFKNRKRSKYDRLDANNISIEV